MPSCRKTPPYYFDKPRAFRYIFNKSIENYVDRNSGACDFSNKNFRSSLEFINSFPPVFTGSGENVSAELSERILSGRQMLAEVYLGCPLEIQQYDAFFGRGGKASFIGFPTEDGSVGSSFQIYGETLAMSSACENKEAAWEFMRKVLLPRYRNMAEMIGNHSFHLTPVNRADYDLMIQCVTRRTVWGEQCVGELPTLKIHRSTQEEVDRFEDLFNSIETINLYDPTVYDIVYEACGPYFAGDKTIDETVALIQNRVSLYLNELQ